MLPLLNPIMIIKTFIALLFSIQSQALLPDTHQSFLSSPQQSEQNLNESIEAPHLLLNQSQITSISNFSISSTDLIHFLTFLNNKLVILQRPNTPSSLQYPIRNSPILFDFLSGLCKFSASVPEFLLLLQKLEFELQDFLFIVVNEHDFIFGTSNLSVTWKSANVTNVTGDEIRSGQDRMFFVEYLIRILEVFYKYTTVVEKSVVEYFCSQQGWVNNATEGWVLFFNALVFSIEKTDSLFKIHSLKNLLNEYRSVFSSLTDNEYTLPCSSSDILTLSKSAEPQCPAQEIANLIHKLRLSYPDSTGEIVLNAANIRTEILYYKELIHLLIEDEIVFIGDTIIDFDKAVDDLQTLERTLEILESEKNVLIFTQGQTSFTEAEITNSEALSTNAYEKISQVFVNFTESVPIVATGNFSQDILSKGTKQILVGNLNESYNDTWDDRVYQNDYIILTSFFADKEGTGKIWVLPLKQPDGIYLLLEGFRQPASVCFDHIHLYLYVVDKKVGKYKGSIYQYKLKVKKSKLELENLYYTKVYSGSPADCKVDFYGNLYFTDNKKNTISIISFADLFSGFKNAYFDIYSYSNNNQKIKNPEKFVFSSSRLIFFYNSDNQAGSINYASTDVDSLNEVSIKGLINSDGRVIGIAYGQNQIFYALEGGNIYSYDLYTKSDQIVSEGFFIDPRGLCVSDYKLYVGDHGKGAVYLLNLHTKSKTLIASIQAVDSLYCINSSLLLILSLNILYLF